MLKRRQSSVVGVMLSDFGQIAADSQNIRCLIPPYVLLSNCYVLPDKSFSSNPPALPLMGITTVSMQ